jgi:hypothetical protein
MSKWNGMNEVTESSEFTDDMDIPPMELRSENVRVKDASVAKEFAEAWLVLEAARSEMRAAEAILRVAKERFEFAKVRLRS